MLHKDKSFKRKGYRQPKPTERVVIGTNRPFEKGNLLKNLEYGQGKAVQYGKHILYTVGSETFGFIEYLILDTKIPDHVVTRTQ